MMDNGFFTDFTGGDFGPQYARAHRKGFNIPEPTTPTEPSFNKGQAMQFAGQALGAFSDLSAFSGQISNLNSQLNTLGLQQAELNRKHGVQTRLLRRQAERGVSNRVEAVQQSGVKMEGSALDVVSDVYFDMLEAEVEMNRANAIANEDMEVARANMETQKQFAGQNLAMNLAARGAKAYVTGGMG